ncbi:MAG: ATP synthase subunit I [Rhodocyclaceae bacterium]|nr:MAG: ATP synthase subunit I [Rhodocyclaceae bacterium]
MLDSGKPLRIVLRWQAVATVLLAVMGAWLAGLHGAFSALLGGAVAIAGGMVFAFLARPPKAQSQDPGTAWDRLTRILKAEGAKVLVIVILLGLVLATYKEVVMVGFIGTFIVAVIIFSMAIFLRNPAQLNAGKPNVD